MTNYLVLDIKNNNSNSYDCKAGCFAVDEIVAIAFNNGQAVRSEYLYPNNPVKLELNEVDVLVGHNITHALLFLWHLGDLQAFFKRGGKIWDTQYAHYTLSGQQEKYPKLRDIAARCYGCPERIKWIDNLLFNKVEPNDYKQVSDLSKDKVLEDVSQDVEDTGKIYLQQVEKAKKLGMYSLLELEMDAILATTEMRFNGMYIDRNIMKKNKDKLEVELKKEYEKLEELIQKYWR